MEIALLTALGVGGATMIGAVLGFLIKHIDRKAFSLAAGIMLAATLWGLLIPALEHGNSITAIAGIFAGALLLDGTDRILYHRKRSTSTDSKLLFVAAIAIHNFPEGIAAGVGCGTGNLREALLIAAGIALQNLPEGMVIIAPMLAAGYSPRKTLIVALLTGLVEVIGATLGYLAVSFATAILPFALAFAGGTMLYVICTEMLPDARKDPYLILVGVSIMILLNSLL